MSHSFGSSFYEFNSQQPNHYKNTDVMRERSEVLSKLSNDRRSMLTTPLVEFDSLNQVYKRPL